MVSISLLISSSSRRRPPPFTFPDVEFVALAIMTYWVPDVRNLAQVSFDPALPPPVSVLPHICLHSCSSRFSTTSLPFPSPCLTNPSPFLSQS